MSSPPAFSTAEVLFFLLLPFSSFRDLDARTEAILAVCIMHAASLGYYVL
jgi:hypothetical protein